jgi:hypothetical protein
MLRYDPGLTASPPARYILRVAGNGYLLSSAEAGVTLQTPTITDAD